MMRRWIGCAAAMIVLLFAGCAPRYADERVAEAVRQLQPSVVMLAAHLPPENPHDAYDLSDGTGTIVASGNWGSDILTVEHAVGGAMQLVVTVGNTHRATGRVIAADAKLDIALVRIGLPNLPVAKLGSSGERSVRSGRSVALLGYPIPDQMPSSLTTSLVLGTISALHAHALELSLPIVPGESGGPVFLTDTGAIVGVVEARLSHEPSIGFALPIDDAKRFLDRYDAIHGL